MRSRVFAAAAALLLVVALVCVVAPHRAARLLRASAHFAVKRARPSVPRADVSLAVATAQAASTPEPAPMPELSKTAFRLNCSAAEVRDGKSIHPEVMPAGLNAKVITRGSGAVKLSSPAGCSFEKGGQQKDNTAFFQFTGPQVGEMFDSATPGEVSFTVRSLVSFANRLKAASQESHSYRIIFTVYEDVTEQMGLSISPHDDTLAIIYGMGGKINYYFLRGTEEATFGKDVTMHIRLAWNGRGACQLFVNGKLAETKAYPRAHPVWSARSSFSIGARDQHEFGGGFFSASDVVLTDFTVRSSGPYKDTVPPMVTFRSPANGQKISGSTFLEASASDDDSVARVRFLADGAPVATVLSYPYRAFWDVHALPPGRHVLAVEATDPAGNTTRKEVAVDVEHDAAPDREPPAPVSSLYCVELQPRQIRVSWLPATDNVAVAEYRVYRDGKVIGSVKVEGVQASKPLVYADTAVEPGHTYSYQVEAVDAARNAALLSAPLELSPPASAGVVRTVGPGQKFTTPCAAILASHAGDTVEIDAAGNGSYDGDVCAWRIDNLTIRGINGRARIDAHGRNANDKGVWVVAGRGNTIENIEISGATVGDHNGAAVRLEGRDTILRHVYFHHNQDGILATVEGGSLWIEFSEFGWDGDGSGQSHNLYILHPDRLVFRYNYSHDAKIGHLLKSRAARNEILYNRLTDENGSASYELDLPNGGLNYVIGNILQQSAASDNDNIVSCGSEGLRPNGPNALYFIGNTLIDGKNNGHFFHVAAMPVIAMNNIFVGAQTILELPPGTKTAGNFRGDPRFVNAGAHDYRLRSDSPARGAGVAVPALPADAPPLTPGFQYVHPAGGGQRKSAARPDAGALP